MRLPWQPHDVVGQNPGSAVDCQGFHQAFRLFQTLLLQKKALPLDEIDNKEGHEKQVHQSHAADELMAHLGGPELPGDPADVGHGIRFLP